MCSIFSYSDFSICIIFGVIFDKVFGSFEKSDCFLLLSFKSILYILHKSFLRHIFFKDFLLVCGFFYLLDSFFHRKEIFHFNDVMEGNFGVESKKWSSKSSFNMGLLPYYLLGAV